MTNCAIYARVSTAEQIKGYSIAAQLDTCRAYITGQNWTLAGEYVDALSGTDDQRPEFQRMIKAALAGEIRVIVVSSFDRFARNLEHSVVYKSLLRREGIQVHSVLEPLDQNSPMSFIHEGIIDLFAAFYSINLSAKIRHGQSKSIENGRWPHKAPIGYENKDGWVEVAETGESIIRAFQEFATGRYTLESWTAAAFQMGIVNSKGGRIAMSHWSKIFNNRFYVGLLSWNGQEIKGSHQPLVDEELYSRVQAVLRGNERYVQHRVYRPYLLRSLLWSVDAACTMNGATGKTDAGGYKYYRSRQRTSTGSYHSVPAEILEGQIETVLSSVFVSPDALSELDGILDSSILLALRVAPHLGAVYHWLNSDEQRQALLNVVVSRYGLRVSGREIVDVTPLPPFGFKFEMGKVEVCRDEPLYSFFLFAEAVQ